MSTMPPVPQISWQQVEAVFRQTNAVGKFLAENAAFAKPNYTQFRGRRPEGLRISENSIRARSIAIVFR